MAFCFARVIALSFCGIAVTASVLAQHGQLGSAAQNQQQEQPATDKAADAAGEAFQFLGPDGKPLPAEVQAQLRKQMAENPQGLSPNDGSISVIGRRTRGSIPFNIPPERAFSPNDLKGFGASNLEELMEALGPLVTSPLAPDGAKPVLLLNGKRVPNLVDIARLPMEAVERTEIFPEQLAAQFGFRSDTKVVNIITRERFSTLLGTLAGRVATEGGYHEGKSSADWVKLKGDLRIGLGANYQRNSSLTEQQRNLVQPAGSDVLGFRRDLVPFGESMELNGNISHPIDPDTSGSITGTFQKQQTVSRSGLRQSETLLQTADTQRADLAIAVARQTRSLLLALNASYLHLQQDTDLSVRINPAADSLSRLRTQAFRADFNLVKEFAIIADRAASASALAEISTSDVKGTTTVDFARAESSLRRNLARFSAGLNMPLTDKTSAIGSVNLNLNASATLLSDRQNTRAYVASLDWAPSSSLRLSLFGSDQSASPDLEQLARPNFVTPNARTFDVVQGRTVDVELLTGGNPGLLNESRNQLQSRLSWKPFQRADVRVMMSFSRLRSKNSIADFPLLTSQSSTAFAERFVRSRAGELTRLDARPVNFFRTAQDKIYWGISFFRSLGPVPEGTVAEGQDFKSVEEARAAFPDGFIFTVAPNSSMARQAENLSSRIYANVYHSWYVRDDVILSRASPRLDLLAGDAVNAAGGRRQHQIEAEAGVYKNGLGIRLTADWRSSTSFRDVSAGGAQTIRFGSFAVVGLRFFANLEEAFAADGKQAWLKNARLTLELVNLFNARSDIRTSTPAAALRYQSPFLDPLGRTVSLTFRKAF